MCLNLDFFEDFKDFLTLETVVDKTISPQSPSSSYTGAAIWSNLDYMCIFWTRLYFFIIYYLYWSLPFFLVNYMCICVSVFEVSGYLRC